MVVVYAVEIVVGVFGLAFVLVLLDDLLFGEMRNKAMVEKMTNEILSEGGRYVRRKHRTQNY